MVFYFLFNFYRVLGYRSKRMPYKARSFYSMKSTHILLIHSFIHLFKNSKVGDVHMSLTMSLASHRYTQSGIILRKAVLFLCCERRPRLRNYLPSKVDTLELQ